MIAMVVPDSLVSLPLSRAITVILNTVPKGKFSRLLATVISPICSPLFASVVGSLPASK